MQKYKIILCLIMIFLSQSFAEQKTTLNLMPVPAKISLNNEKFRLNDKFTIAVTGECNKKLFEYSTKTLRRLSGRTGIFFPQDFITSLDELENPSMLIKSDEAAKVKLYIDESYSLKINQSKIFLSAKTDIGAIRGLETLLQLLDIDDQGYFFPTLEITDSPRFAWRGLMIDVSRNFKPVEVIKRNLDGMAAVKLNVFHFHLVDDQGFRVECKNFPKLHEVSSDGLYYTHDQIKDIIQYAANLGIRVVPEFDIPAHATSWIFAYPELGSGAVPKSVERKWGIFNPTLNPAKESTYEFLDKFLQEMTGLFTDEYFHIGGDENNGDDWNNNPEIQKFMQQKNISNNHALQAYFNQRILKILTKYNRKMVGWEEIMHENMPKNIVIQAWYGKETLVKAARSGFQVMLSKGYYIDLIHPTVRHYLNDPIPADSPLSDIEKKLIIGGEATMWGEFVTSETIDSRIWPRTAAIAERFWSPQNIRNVDDMYRRLEITSFRLEELGLTHIKNYEMMLRRLTNNEDIFALKTLVDVIEPVKFYRRNRLFNRKYRSFSPYTRVVDAARPDQKVARNFRNMIDDFIDHKQPNTEEIKYWLNLWQNNHKKLLITIKNSPILREIEPLSENLSLISGIGLEAIDIIEQDKKVDKEWKKSSLEILEKAKEPYGQTEIMIVSGIKKLIELL